MQHAQSLNTRQVRPVYGGPATNDDRCISVCIGPVAASEALKPRLGFSVGWVHRSARRAGARAVSWINPPNRNSSPLGFIGNKALKLAESPGVQTGPLRFSSP